MTEIPVEIKCVGELVAVLVRTCNVADAVETTLFGDVDTAMRFCERRWEIIPKDWDPYLVASDPKSSMKLNGEGVRYCGWKYQLDETQSLHLHLKRKVVD